MKSRWLSKLYANAFGYFWNPCPLCGQNFGGHEWVNDYERQQSIWPEPGSPLPHIGKAICQDCARQGKGNLPEFMVTGVRRDK